MARRRGTYTASQERPEIEASVSSTRRAAGELAGDGGQQRTGGLQLLPDHPGDDAG